MEGNILVLNLRAEANDIKKFKKINRDVMYVLVAWFSFMGILGYLSFRHDI
jgi:hypothetical protein